MVNQLNCSTNIASSPGNLFKIIPNINDIQPDAVKIYAT